MVAAAGNKADVESGAVVVGEYSIIELHVRVAILLQSVFRFTFKVSLAGLWEWRMQKSLCLQTRK